MSYSGTIDLKVNVDLGGFEPALAEMGKLLEGLASGGIKAFGDGIISALLQVEKLNKAFKAANDVSGDMSTMLRSLAQAGKDVDKYAESVGGLITAEQLEKSALGAKEVLMGALEGKIGLATAAQQLWNAALKANLVGTLVVAVTAAIAAVTALTALFVTSSPEYQKQSAAVKELTDAQKGFAEAAKNSQEASEKNLASIDSNTKDSRRLLATLSELSQNYDRAAGDQQRMAVYVKKLNEEQEGLNLTFDEQTGALSMAADEIEAYIAAKDNMAKANAYIERENELYKEQAEIAENLKLIALQREEVENSSMFGFVRMAKLHELDEAEKGYLEAQEENTKRLAIVEESYAELDTQMSQVVLDNAKAKQEASAQAAQAAEEEVQNQQEAMGSYAETATNALNTMNDKSDESKEKMQENLLSTQEAMENHSQNMEALREKFAALGLDDALLVQFENMGEQGAAYLAILAQASGEQLQQLNEAYTSGGMEAVQALLDSLEEPDVAAAGSQVVDDTAAGVAGNPALAEETKTMVSAAKQAAEQQVQDSNFSTLGSMMMSGIAAGIKDGKSSVVEAAKAAVREAVDAARREAEVNSPSRKTRRQIGRPFAQGIALGISDEEASLAAQVAGTVEKLENAARQGLFGGGGIQGAAQRLAEGVRVNHLQVAAALPQAGVFAAAQPAGAAGAGPASYTQNFNFYQPVQTPDETARAIRLQTTYGLAGDVG